ALCCLVFIVTGNRCSSIFIAGKFIRDYCRQSTGKTDASIANRVLFTSGVGGNFRFSLGETGPVVAVCISFAPQFHRTGYQDPASGPGGRAAKSRMAQCEALRIRSSVRPGSFGFLSSSDCGPQLGLERISRGATSRHSASRDVAPAPLGRLDQSGAESHQSFVFLSSRSVVDRESPNARARNGL